MAQFSSSQSVKLERQEWEVVLEALSRTPRLAKLLRYIGELYFQGRVDEITEFRIATQVFGRPETVFDSSKDSIARVEAYRLRKRLKEYYEAEGMGHDTTITLPIGSYAPAFVHRLGASSPQPAYEPGMDSGQLPSGAQEAAESAQHPARKRIIFFSLAGTVALAAVIALALFISHRGAWQRSPGVSEPNRPLTATPTNPAHVPLRLLAGYEGSPRIDSMGDYWEADRYYSGGIARPRPDKTATKTSDPMLFEHWRLDNATYDIPLSPGPYELHLFFIAPQEEDTNLEFFGVDLNGKVLLKAFNISSDAFGNDVADERVFRDVYPSADGFLHLRFYADRSAPSISAIEILPGLPHKQIPIRLVTQRSAVTDSSGNVWHPDTYFQNGRLSDLPQKVSGTSDPSLYARERYGHFIYSIPVDTRGRYTVVLHFSELYWGPDTGAGQRVFRVFCNGNTLLDNFDIFKEAGSLRAITKTFHHLQPSSAGKLDLTFDPIANYATVSAIEVIDESE